MAKPVVIVVGADKGGVGKTTVSRTLLDYFSANNVPTRAFDIPPEPSDWPKMVSTGLPSSWAEYDSILPSTASEVTPISIQLIWPRLSPKD